jgi:hypothetical protein
VGTSDSLRIRSMALLEHPTPLVDRHVDETSARRALRGQIAKLEHDLVMTATGAFPRLPLPAVAGRGGPRLLSLGELEAVRDDLAGELSSLRAERTRIADVQAQKRVLVEKMLLDPGQYRWVRVTGEDVGEPGCKTWHVKPRLGIVGMLAGWWHVKISSGCPLAWGPWRTPRSRTH